MTDSARPPFDPARPGAPPLGPASWPQWLLLLPALLAARLPWALQRGLGRALGWLLFRLLASRRRVAGRNLELCFPEFSTVRRARLLRDSFGNLGIGLFEFIRAWWGSIDAARRHSRIDGLHHLKAALAEGRGVILLSGHFVNLEICGRLLCDHAPVAGMYRPHGQAVLEWAVRRGRLRYAPAMFPRDALRPAIKHLKDGGILWFAPDQETRRGDSLFVPFFGRPAWSLTSPHQLARLSGAKVIAFHHRRNDDGRGYHLRLTPALSDFPSKDASADTARVMAEVEAMVRAAPEQYLWIHRRFKKQPDDRDVYADPPADDGPVD